jgi:hypothetical protein
MAFETMLVYSVELGGEADGFSQKDPICLAYTTKWLIDQLLGRRFVMRHEHSDGDVSKTKKKIDELILKRRISYRKAQRIKVLGENASVREKTNTLQKKLGLMEHTSAQALGSHLQEKGLKVDINTIRPVKNPVKHSDIQYSAPDIGESMPIAGIGYELPHCICAAQHKGYIISVRTERTGSANSPTYNHAMGAFTIDKWVRYFDPNMGEVRLPSVLFPLWFRKYCQLWKEHQQMRLIDSWYLSDVSSVGGIDGYIKSIAKNRMSQYLKDSNDESFEPFGDEAISMTSPGFVEDYVEKNYDPYDEFVPFEI